MATFILTAIGDDRPGLVSALSAPITAHGASWERSQLTRLAGKFAGVVLVDVADDRYDALVADLQALEGLRVTVDRSDAVAPGDSQRLQLELLGADHPGIVAEISASLAAHGVGIEELATDVREAPMAGGTLFEARAVLSAPVGVSAEDLRSTLEALADELMVDLTLSDERPGA
jgi:glycine cleavage system regulatory protein